MEYLKFLYQIAFAVVFADMAIRLFAALMSYVVSVVTATYERHHLTPRLIMMLGVPLVTAALMSFAIATIYSGIIVSYGQSIGGPVWYYYITALVLVYATIGSRIDLELDSPLDFLTLVFSMTGIVVFWMSPPLLTNFASTKILETMAWVADMKFVGWVIGAYAILKVGTALLSLVTSGGIWLVKGSRRLPEWFYGAPPKRKFQDEECHIRARRLEV